MSLIPKYNGEQDVREHGGPLHWPGVNGLPVRGPLEYLRQDEIEDRARLEKDFRFELFDLSNPRDHAVYQEVMDRVANGWYELVFRTEPRIETVPDPRPDEPAKTRTRVVVYVEWNQVYYSTATRSVRNAEIGQ